jgi:hypothetical protein
VEAALFDSGTATLQYSSTPALTGQMDLLTVLAHELGHVIGRGDLDPHAHDIMAGELAPGVREVAVGEALEVSDPWPGIAGQESGIGSQESGVWVRESGDFGFQISDFGFSSGNADVWQRSPCDGSNGRYPTSRTSRSAFRIRDALFARLDDRAGAITDDYDSLVEQDDSSDEAEDGLDLWLLL